MRKIKQTILVVVAFFAATTFSKAQSYTIDPNDTVEVNAALEDLQTLSIIQLNNTMDTLTLKWSKVSEYVPANWEASVCDNQFCNTTLIDSGTMNPVYPTEYGLLLIHCTPHVNYGTAVIRYAVWDVNFPNTRDTLTYMITVTPTGIATTNFETPSVWFSQNKIHLENVDENYSSLSLMDINGKEIFNSTINNQTAFDLPVLSTAVYIVQLNGKQKLFQQRIFYQK